MLNECIFCKIAEGTIPARMLHEDPEMVAFEDINPQAPRHILVVPKKHFRDLPELVRQGGAALCGRLLQLGCEVAEREGLAARGFRVVLNTGSEAGQSVFHVHMHLLGGRPMAWPPG